MANIIMYVEDEENAREAFKSYFGRKSYIVHAYETAKEAEEALKTIKPQVIISDQKLGGNTLGWEFLVNSKKLSPTSCRFILTGYSDIDMAVSTFLEAQIFGYIQKSETSEAIEKRISAACEWWNWRYSSDSTGKQNPLPSEITYAYLEHGRNTLAEELAAKEKEIERLKKELEQAKRSK